MKISVIGGGSWGTSMGILLAKAGRDVVMWGRDPKQMAEMAEHRENRRYLPGATFPESLTVTNSLEEALVCPVVMLAIPLQSYRKFLTDNHDHFSDQELILLSKGMEIDTQMLPTQIVCSVLGASWEEQTFMLSGPSFAKEVAEFKATTVVLAGKNAPRLAELQKLMMCPTFRVYNNADVMGVEIAGALKNVMAIASGIAQAKDLGHNAMAALITRGLVEIARLGESLGAQRETFAGLAGMGDLILTCTGGLSRNLRVGIALGQGKSLDQILSELGMVAEGVHTCRAATSMAKERHIELPITEVVHAILYEGVSPEQGLRELMTRSPKWESTNKP